MAKGGALDLSIHIMGKVDNSFNAAIHATQSQVSNLSRNLSKIGTAGLAAMGALGAGTIKVIADCTKQAQEFEQQMSDVVKYVDGLADANGKISDKTFEGNGKTYAQNYDMMKDAIMDLSAQIPYTREELTKLAAAAGQSGYSIDELIKYDENGHITGFLRDVAMWGTAMDIEAEQAGNWAAKWEKAFNMDHSQIMEVADIINYLGANTATTAAEIANAVNSAASMGQIAGVDVKATAALADAMLATGVSSDRVGTSLKRIYTNVSKGTSATKTQKAAWEELGFTATGVAKAMQEDGAGTLLKVFEAIDQMPDERKVATLSNLFGQWAIEGAAKITGNISTYTDALRMVTDPSLYEGSMMREFAIKANTVDAVQQMTQHAFENLEIDIGEAFLPVKKQFLMGLIDFMDGLRKNAPQIEQLATKMANVLSLGMDKLGQTLENAMPSIEKGLDYILNNGDQIVKIIGGLAAAFGAMKLAPMAEMLFNGAGSLLMGGNMLGGAAGKAGGGLFSTLGNLFMGGVNTKNGLVAGAGALAEGAALGTKYRASGKTGLFGNLRSGIMGMIGAGQNMGGLLNPKTHDDTAWNLGTSLFNSGLLTQHGKKGGGIMGMLGNMIGGSKAGQAVGSYAGGIGKALGGVLENPIAKAVGGALGQAGGFLGMGFKGLGSGFGSLFKMGGEKALEGIGGLMYNFASTKAGQGILRAGGTVAHGIGKAANFIGAGIPYAKEAGGLALAGGKNLLGLGGGILSTVSTAAAPITGIFSSIIAGALPIVGIITSIIAVVSILGDNLDGIRGIVQNVFGDQGVAIFDTFIGKLQEIGTFIQSLFGTGLSDMLMPFKESITNMFGEDAGLAFEGLVGILQSVMNVVQQIVNFAVTQVKPIIEEIINYVVNTAMPLFLQTFSECAPIIAELITKISGIIMQVAKIIINVINQIKPYLSAIVTGILNFISGALPNLLTAISNICDNIKAYIDDLVLVFTGIIDFIVGVFTGDWDLAWQGVVKVFNGVFGAIADLGKAIINAVIGVINGFIGGINNVAALVPESWGGGFQIGTIPYLAKGGFTNGPSIAGEAGTEAVISFQRGVRDQNIATWARAGQMLGIDTLQRSPEVALADIGDYGSYTGGAVTFSPQITINGNADDAVMDRAIAKMQSEFEKWYRERQRMEARTRY